MQHPTRALSGVFDDHEDTACNHTVMDIKRGAYVTRAMNEANNEGLTDIEIAKAGLRAAIEFTPNHFTAPVTANDVYPHNRLKKVMKGKTPSDKAKTQTRAREEMKDQNERLGGTLRAPIAGETKPESILRNWRQDDAPTPTEADDVLVEPPSPRRYVE